MSATQTSERDELQDIPSAEPACPTVFYDVEGKDYWIQDARENWISVNETSLRRLLRVNGFSTKARKGEIVSPVDKATSTIQLESNVGYAGPLAGYPKGPIDVSGQRVLVTTSAKLIEAKQKPYLLLQKLLGNMFGEVQLPFFKGWVKTGYESLRSGTKRPGQALVLAGPRDSYKSLLQNLLTEIFGGRVAKPYRYMSGATDFNGELFSAEHLMIEDEIASCDIRARRNFGARIKDFTVNEIQSCHAKNRQALSLVPFWRVTVSVNEEPENLLILPPLDDSLADKLLLLKVFKQDPLMPTNTNEERRHFRETLYNELPGFLWDLEHWEIPAAIQSGRFGVTHFHHPDLVRAIEESTPETKLLALIDTAFDKGILKGEAGFTDTAEELESTLSVAYPAEARRLFSWTGAVGTYLGRLADKHPERVEQKRTADRRLWIIRPPQKQ